eukprot:scaffold379382_cov37-Prasinocladus_malaysianus.AAC.1
MGAQVTRAVAWKTYAETCRATSSRSFPLPTPSHNARAGAALPSVRAPPWGFILVICPEEQTADHGL